MWSVITHYIAFLAGTVCGIVLICLMQTAKKSDEWMELRKGGRENEAGDC